jgi:pyruvate dehydrogenase E1 component alpha subunit
VLHRNWGLATEQELKVFIHHGPPHNPISHYGQALDKVAKAEVDAAVEEVKASPEPAGKELWTDIYYKGTEPPFMRGREQEEVHYY